MAETNYDAMLFERASSMLRTQGILAIVFGGLGVLGGFMLMIAFAFGAMAEYTSAGAIGSLLTGVATFVFLVLPHIYLVISGVTLLRNPKPTVARALTIINLIVGVFWNLIILIFAIICLTQSGDYERYYAKHNK